MCSLRLTSLQNSPKQYVKYVGLHFPIILLCEYYDNHYRNVSVFRMPNAHLHICICTNASLAHSGEDGVAQLMLINGQTKLEMV